ncbi:MAG: hypothetical protein IPK32_12675 [Verrucomicrobiaceae bacterium]|nr:hypothetical protein [Verrucomicrobiaceae bacterium]
MRTLLCLLAVFASLIVHADEFDPKDNTIVLGERVGLIKPGMSAKDIERAYGKGSLKQMKLDGPEGTEIEGARLFAGADRELEIIWDEEKKTVSDIRIVGKAWSFANGLKIGLSIAEVEKINGKPYKVSGFDWDYGGYANFEGGKLAEKVSVRFEAAEGTDPSLSGDKQIPTTNKKLRSSGAKVSEISVFMR